MHQPADFRPAERSHTSILAALEKKFLIWIAQRLPASINSDQLTALGFLSLAGVGVSYWYAGYSRTGLLLAILFLISNWFGDSLDGTLARVRNQQRPRYGFYVDHMLDACGSAFLFGGLALSTYMSPAVAVALLVVYLLLSIEAYLATYSVGRFHLSFGAFGPTELRLLLIAGNIALFLGRSQSVIAGHTFRLFDIGGCIGIAGMAFALVWSIVSHTLYLYRLETPRPVVRRLSMAGRWLRFNTVGVAGFALQLALIWAFARAGMHYLAATALAVELAVLHNFIWHERWTWRDRGIEGRWRRLLRFHIANGFVSVASNVALTGLLMRVLGAPLLVANAGAVLIVAILNFVLAERWVFAPATEHAPEPAGQ